MESPRLPAPPPESSDLPGERIPPGGWHQPITQARVPGELAGWWSRVGASLIDAVIIALPALVLTVLVAAVIAGPLGGLWTDEDDPGVLAWILVAALWLILVASAMFATVLAYAPLTMRRRGARNGQTWGKQLLGIRVVRMGGEPFTFGTAAIREVAVKLLLFGVVGGVLAVIPAILDLLWPLWDGENRALHDMLVDTRVVRARE